MVKSSAPGFTPDPGTSQTQGQLPLLTARLDALGKALGVTIYGISGYRTPAHSVAVGGYAHDPHTQGKAEDIGVNSLLRSSAAQISEAEFARFGLYRPFDPSGDANNTEVNHIQLIPSGGPLTLAQSQAAWDPDPPAASGRPRVTPGGARCSPEPGAWGPGTATPRRSAPRGRRGDPFQRTSTAG